MTRYPRRKQPFATIEEDPVTGPYWALRLPVHSRYDIATVSRILGLGITTVRYRIKKGTLTVDAEGWITHASLVRALDQQARRILGQKYRKRFMKQIQIDFEVEVPDVHIE